MAHNDVKPLVSIYLLTYNQEKYVEDTLLSVYNQTYKNIELLIFDDASTDNTVRILKAYINKLNKRFTAVRMVLNSSNSGNIAKNVNI